MNEDERPGFSWTDHDDAIITKTQMGIAVYENPEDNIVIRQEALSGDPEEDPVVIVAPRDLRTLIAALQGFVPKRK